MICGRSPFSQDHRTSILPSLVARASDDGQLGWCGRCGCVSREFSHLFKHVLEVGCSYLPSSFSFENCCSSTKLLFETLESFFIILYKRKKPYYLFIEILPSFSSANMVLFQNFARMNSFQFQYIPEILYIILRNELFLHRAVNLRW